MTAESRDVPTGKGSDTGTGTSRFRIPSARPTVEDPGPFASEGLSPEAAAQAPEKTGASGDPASPTPVSPVSPRPFSRLLSLAEQDLADDVYTPAPKTNPVVDALIAKGLHLKDEGEGFHRLTCPWAEEHPPGVSCEAGYLEPSWGNPIGRFRCTHVHPDKPDEESLIRSLGLSAGTARARPVIRILPGESHRAAAAAERVLAADKTYYNAGGPIVRIIERPELGISSELVNEQTLVAVLASKIDWERKGRGGEWERCDPASGAIQSLRHGQDRPYLPKLLGLSRQPFYGSDGRLVTASGYDAPTGIYAAFDEAEYDLTDTSRGNAERQLDYLKWLLREFQFSSAADRAAALAAILTAAVRPSLSQAPAFNINAPRSGGGKSYLASLIALAAGPGEPYSVSYPTTAEEAAKLILAMLLEKPAVILFDDMQAQTGWKSLGPINKALTSPTTTERLLGSSRTATARTNVLFLGTGNNVEPANDMRRRVVSVRLAPRSETPTLQRYAFNPVVHIRKRRAHIVQAALSIIEAYRAAGQPVEEVPSIGSYEDWSMFCRHPLIWLGEPDPATSLIEQVQQDTDQDALGDFLKVWFRLFDDDPMMVREVVPHAAGDRKFAEALEEIDVMDGLVVNKKRLGWYLKNNRGRWAKGLRIESGPNSQRNTWRVIEG